ncbi:energy transducer TonB [Burkholderia gladioli]|uniref:energy transducer TonB n=1 Tax=Burkholderia gladioli TaxID=28095 RepID=UPI003F7934E2
MALIDKLLHRTLAPAQPDDPHIVRVFARVLLDKAGRVQDVKLSRGCGDAALDQQALAELRQGRHPVTRVGATIACRWHEVVWSTHVQSGSEEGVSDQTD